MSRESDRVLAGFMRLSPDDQSIVVDALSDYLKKNAYDKNTMKQEIIKRAGISLGPLGSGGCPCCGR